MIDYNLNVTNIIKNPIITDKATRLLENNQYSFITNPSSDKDTIKKTIEYLFNVKVIKINTCNLPKKKSVLVNILVGNHVIKKLLLL